jgi:excinuclease ABC subunit C
LHGFTERGAFRPCRSPEFRVYERPAPKIGGDQGNFEMLSELVAQKLDGLPVQPGCYVFYGEDGKVLYVGKAKSLRSRVRSYFQDGGSDTRAFISALPRLLHDIQTFVTASEKEAAILENSLIKELEPRLNVKLRDDKEYLNLRLDPKAEWPRLEPVRRPVSDGADYFGPYHSATAARRTLHLVEKHFRLRTCSDRELKSRSRPCIQYQIQRCPAPCVYEVDRAEYAGQVRAVELFLAGRHDQLSQELAEKMRISAQKMQFEMAAIYRDQLDAVSKVRESQRVVTVSDLDQDVLGLHREGDLVELSVVYVRQGRVIEICNVSHTRTDVPDDEIVAAFLRQHYGEGGLGSAAVPDEILVPELPEGALGIVEWLSDRRRTIAGGRIARPEILAPQRGPKKQLLMLAQENAEHAFREKRRTTEDMDERLALLQAKLRLPHLPRAIECCDISHLGGEATVGSVVRLTDGLPDKKLYKAYHVKTVSDGDDYGAMYEVLSRRFARGQAELKDRRDEASSLADEDGVVPDSIESGAEGRWRLPDLFVVDGGRGQLGVAVAVAEELGLKDLPLAGLAKERETVTGDKLVDRVYLPGQKNPISLRPNTPELFLLARIRDEAHRFANYQRERLGKRRRIRSTLDDVPGIGPKTRKALLVHFGSLTALSEASDEEILSVRGVSRRQVAALRAAGFSPSPQLASAPIMVLSDVDSAEPDSEERVPSELDSAEPDFEGMLPPEVDPAELALPELESPESEPPPEPFPRPPG